MPPYDTAFVFEIEGDLSNRPDSYFYTAVLMYLSQVKRIEGHSIKSISAVPKGNDLLVTVFLTVTSLIPD